jgi:hypothetical protein
MLGVMRAEAAHTDTDGRSGHQSVIFRPMNLTFQSKDSMFRADGSGLPSAIPALTPC